MISARVPWLLLAAVVGAQVGYPLTGGTARTGLVVATIVLGFVLSAVHAGLTRGWWTAAIMIAVTGGGGLAVETLGVATGHPFGAYVYSGDLGPRLSGVPLVIPLAWTWMAWPAWLAAVSLARRPVPRIALATIGLASWDLFLDPQMVAEGYWTWADPDPALPGVPGVPVGNYLGWLLVSFAMMALLRAAVRTPAAHYGTPADLPMHALYLWTYGSQVLAHAVFLGLPASFLGLPASALWGGLGMGTIAVPLAVVLWRAAAAPRHAPACP